MEPGPNLPGYIATLNGAELLIRRLMNKVDAAPFVAHCDLSEADKAKYSAGFKAYLNGEVGRLPEAIRRWPLVSVWNFAVALSREYGQDGNAVYAVLGKKFDVDIEGEVRNRISVEFRRVCRIFGLCYEGSGRLVNDYLAQSGIAESQLHYVAKAFLFAERAFGAAPYEITSALNSWEIDAAEFIPPGVRIPRMVLQVDQSAHYAFQFTRHRRGEIARNQFERLFFEEISKAEIAVTRGQQRAETVPRPSLTWNQVGLVLSIPKLEGRLSISLGGEVRKLRGGQNWPLPMPWPSHIQWSFGEHSEPLPVFPGDVGILAFEHEYGRLVGKLDPARESSVSVDAREVTLVAASPFSAAGEAASEVGLNGYAIHCMLTPDPIAIQIGSRTLRVSAKPKPRIWLENGGVAKGPKGFLLKSKASLAIEYGELENKTFDLALSIGKHNEVIPLTASVEGEHTVQPLPSVSANCNELVPVRAELRLHGSNRALVRYKAWLWPGLAEFKDELVFDSGGIPPNYAPDHSRHIVVDQEGQLCLDTDASYEMATLGFRVGHERVEFQIPKPGISILYTDPEGRTVSLKVGETLVVRDEDKGGYLCIRCPDRQAQLIVRGRLELHAFWRSAVRVLSLADLSSHASRDDITIQRSGAGSVPLVLLHIVPAVSPAAFSVTHKAETVSLRLEAQIDVDAIRFSLEDEHGNSEVHECAVGHRPVSGRAPDWLDVRLDPENFRRILATADLMGFDGELSLANISIRPTGSETFRPLRNMRGDSYAILLKPFGSAEAEGVAVGADAQERFIVLNTWMQQCFSVDCWDYVGPRIQPRWTSIGKALDEQPGGRSVLLACAHAPQQPGGSRSWVPLSHPLQIIPSLYGSPAGDFQSLAMDGSEGSEHLALLAKTAGRTIPEIHRSVGLSPAFLGAFANFEEAQKAFVQADDSPVRLRGFEFEKYKMLFQWFDENPGARWFWQVGDELLGPAHYGAALGRLTDRLYDAGLEEDGSNDARIRAATSLAHAASKLNEITAPTPKGIEESYALLEWSPSFFSGFARASRASSVMDYLTRIGATLNRPYRSLLGDAAFLIRMAPELLAFYLLLWELSSERTSA